MRGTFSVFVLEVSWNSIASVLFERLTATEKEKRGRCNRPPRNPQAASLVNLSRARH